MPPSHCDWKGMNQDRSSNQSQRGWATGYLAKIGSIYARRPQLVNQEHPKRIMSKWVRENNNVAAEHAT